MATTAPDRLAALFDADFPEDDVLPSREPFRANFNVAPTTNVFMLTGDVSSIEHETRDETHRRRTLRRAHWGLIPSWSKDRLRASSMINARSETITQKPSFRPLVARHRCIVPVDGYYEWKTVGVSGAAGSPKQPYLIRSRKEAPLALAGLWTTWRDPVRSAVVVSCAIITTTANQHLAAIHDRMPCILDEGEIDDWLSEPTPPLEILRPIEPERLRVVPVGTAVNSVRNNEPSLLEEVVIEDKSDAANVPPATLF